MTYPKKVMRTNELVKIGFPKEYLMAAYRTQQFAWKADPGKRNSPILFDTEELEKYRQQQIRTEKMALKHIMAM